MTDQREKRIQEIQKYVNDTKRWNHKHPELKHDPALPMADVDYLLDEISRLQVERDKAIEGLRWYADDARYNIFDNSTAISVKGVYARRILSELGVSHETT